MKEGRDGGREVRKKDAGKPEVMERGKIRSEKKAKEITVAQKNKNRSREKRKKKYCVPLL